MKLSRLPFLALLAINLSCHRSAPIEVGQRSDHAVAVSLNRLLEDSKGYAGKTVRVSGVLRVEFEGTCLSVDESAYKNRDYQRSLWADVAPELESLNGQWVTLEATFSPESHGHMGGWRRGSLQNVTFVSSAK